MSQEDKERPASHSAAAASHDGLSVKVGTVSVPLVDFLAVLNGFTTVMIQILLSLFLFFIWYLLGAADPTGPGSAALSYPVLRIRDPVLFVLF